jgi:hypothetical protein
MFELLKDLWGFARERKKYWLVPLIGTLVLRAFHLHALLDWALCCRG